MPTPTARPEQEAPPEGVMRLELLTPHPDPKGHSAFTLTWRGYRPDLDAEGARAQYFHGNLAQHLRDLHARGWRVDAEGRNQQAARDLIERVQREQQACPPAVQRAANLGRAA